LVDGSRTGDRAVVPRARMPPGRGRDGVLVRRARRPARPRARRGARRGAAAPAAGTRGCAAARGARGSAARRARHRARPAVRAARARAATAAAARDRRRAVARSSVRCGARVRAAPARRGAAPRAALRPAGAGRRRARARACARGAVGSPPGRAALAGRDAPARRLPSRARAATACPRAAARDGRRESVLRARARPCADRAGPARAGIGAGDPCQPRGARAGAAGKPAAGGAPRPRARGPARRAHGRAAGGGVGRARGGRRPQRRRALHARLAELVGDAEPRARHLALATVEPDSVAAEQVEAGAVAAAARGAPPAAAELLELSARLTPADLPAEKARRLTAAAEQHVLAGASPRAQELLDGVLASAVRGPPRARAVLHFVLAKSGADLDVGLLNEALTEVGEDAALEAEILAQLASYAYAGNPLHVDEGERYGWASLEAAGRSGDPAVLARALASLSGILFNRGRGVPEELMERALALDPACDSVPIAQRPVTLFGWMWKWAGDLDRSRALLERARRIGEERGDATIADVLWFSSFLEFLAGDWPRGLTLADEVRELGVQSERAEVLLCADCANAVLYAHLGDEGKAREAASGASERAESLGFWHAAIIAGWGLGVLELSVGRPAKALEHAREASAFHRAGGVEEPSLNFSFPIHAEAAIAVGELDEAVELLDWIEERAVRLDREWALACIARCRGLLAAAGGDETTAVASFERALAEHARVQYRRFDRAHTLLAQGTTLRRFKKKRPAREALEKALAIFEELGARLWADRTRGELERIGGRTRSAGELTATERRVAELVAAGRTN